MTVSLVDNYSRKFEYLRLSLTDSCNFKCHYCLPNGFKPTSPEKQLNQTEIGRLIQCFTELGMWKIRLTGGEPTLRPDFEKIVSKISSMSGVKNLVASTNGFRLVKSAQTFYNAGLRGINVSVDSLNEEEFYKITGRNELSLILKGIEKALEIGYESVKINVVLLKGFQDKNLESYLSYISHKNISVRFIELMQTNQNTFYFNQHHVNSSFIKNYLQQIGFTENTRKPGDGPAAVFSHPQFQGTIGIIAPYSKNFCVTCNRLRVSSRGVLKLCLFGNGGINLRPYLQHDNQKEELSHLVLSSLKLKKDTHFLHEGNSGDTPNLASIGG